jgi:predicted ATPase/class 3 adenylate cyclase
VHEGQSVTATVLFTDLVGSTELLSRLGEQAFDGLRRAHFAALREAIAKAGGTDVKGLGDGVLATFSSAAQAIGCGVAMQQAVDLHGRTAGIPLALRVGLALGDVVFDDGDVFGTPVVEAARLVAAARGGQILVTELVRMVAGRRCTSEFTDLGSLQLKGLPEPVPVCEVAWEPLAGPSLPLPVLLTEVGRIFVGRDGEVGRLGQLWEEAAAGARWVALLAGEPGVGKTRLIAELAGAVHAEGATVLAGRCDEDMGVPYQPFVEAIRHFVDHTQVGDLPRSLGRYGGELVRLVPDLVDRVEGLPPPLRSDPETERYRLFDAVGAWLTGLSAQQPVLLVIDDLQWAAKPTLLLLRHVVRSTELKRILILGAYRDTELDHDHPLVEVLADLRRQGGVERLSLSGLDQTALTAFMAQAAGHEMDDAGLALARAIHAETEGNPFFVREVIRHLTETGAIVQREGRWVTSVAVDGFGIPEGVREVVGRRLARLSVDANKVLRVAAVIGTEFEFPLIRAAAEGLNEEVLLSALEEAIAARLVLEISGPAPRHRFTHALVRDTIYHGFSAARRVALHRRVAEAIETLHACALDDHLPALAHHWARATPPALEKTPAVDYARRAGDRALAQLAHDEAAQYYCQALGLIDAAGGTSDTAERIDLLIALGEAQRRAGDRAHRETLLEAGRLAQGLADAERAARAALANQRGFYSRYFGIDVERVAALEAVLQLVSPAPTAVRARLLANLATELHFANDERPVALGRQALVIARAANDPVTLAHVLVALWFASWGIADLAERVQLANELTEIAEKVGDRSIEFQAAVAGFLTATEQGNMDHARSALATCTRLADELGQPVLRWRVAYLQTNWALALGCFEEVERLAADSLRLGDAAGQPEAFAFSRAPLFFARLWQGRPKEAAALVAPVLEQFPSSMSFRLTMACARAEAGETEHARSILADMRTGRFTDVPHDYLWLLHMCLFGYACCRFNEVAWAQELYDLLLPHRSAIAVSQTCGFGPVAHHLGCLATALGRLDEADGHFAQAAEVQARIGADGTLVHTRLAWAQMLIERGQLGDVERAKSLLSRALVTARELGLANVERRVVTLLSQVV